MEEEVCGYTTPVSRTSPVGPHTASLQPCRKPGSTPNTTMGRGSGGASSSDLRRKRGSVCEGGQREERGKGRKEGVLT